MRRSTPRMTPRGAQGRARAVAPSRHIKKTDGNAQRPVMDTRQRIASSGATSTNSAGVAAFRAQDARARDGTRGGPVCAHRQPLRRCKDQHVVATAWGTIGAASPMRPTVQNVGRSATSTRGTSGGTRRPKWKQCAALAIVRPTRLGEPWLPPTVPPPCQRSGRCRRTSRAVRAVRTQGGSPTPRRSCGRRGRKTTSIAAGRVLGATWRSGAVPAWRGGDGTPRAAPTVRVPMACVHTEAAHGRRSRVHAAPGARRDDSAGPGTPTNPRKGDAGHIDDGTPVYTPAHAHPGHQAQRVQQRPGGAQTDERGAQIADVRGLIQKHLPGVGPHEAWHAWNRRGRVPCGGWYVVADALPGMHGMTAQDGVAARGTHVDDRVRPKRLKLASVRAGHRGHHRLARGHRAVWETPGVSTSRMGPPNGRGVHTTTRLCASSRADTSSTIRDAPNIRT